MKNLLFYSCLLGLMVSTSCGDGGQASQQQAPAQSTEAAPEAAPVNRLANMGVCLWDGAGLRDAAGKDAKWVAGISFGEVVVLSGQQEEISAENRTYLEIELADGKKGWSNGYLFATGAARAVALSDMDVYKRPDLTTYTGDKFAKGEIFALIPTDKDGWMEAYGKNKKKSGWVQAYEAAYSTDEVDVTVGILVDRAMQEKDPAKQEEALNRIAGNSTFSASPLMSVVDAQLAEVAARPELPANQLYITADNLNVRSEPDSEADNIVFKLEQGAICTIMERGERVKIRDMDDYWYKIEKDGQSGWIYGYFTSKRR